MHAILDRASTMEEGKTSLVDWFVNACGQNGPGSSDKDISGWKETRVHQGKTGEVSGGWGGGGEGAYFWAIYIAADSTMSMHRAQASWKTTENRRFSSGGLYMHNSLMHNSHIIKA